MPGKIVIPFRGTPDATKSGLNHASDASGWYKYQDALRGFWTPTLSATTTPPTLGTNSQQYGDYVYHAGWIRARFLIVFGTAGVAAGSGTYEMGGLPFAPEVASVGGSVPVGQVHLRDIGTASKYWTAVMTNLSVIRFNDPNGVEVTNAAPWVWAASDSLRGEIFYGVDE